MRRLLFDSAANTLARTKNFLDRAGKSAAKRLVAHRPGNFNNLIERDIATVSHVLNLLAVTRRLLQGYDNEGLGRGHHGDSSLTVLDRELDRHAETLPLTRSLGNIFTNLLGGLS